MINLDNMRTIIVSQLKNYLGIPVIRGNTTAELPSYPFVSYNITQLMKEHKGTWCKCDDGIDRIPMTQTWSITIQSSDCAESMNIAMKTHDWFAHVGVQYLKDNKINVRSIGDITNRDNIITVGYEYKNGFDVDFSIFNETTDTIYEIGEIQTANIKEVVE